MRGLHRDVLSGIGNTSLLALRNIVPKSSSRILLKIESQNPTGSMKDRMALAMIEAAEADGRLGAGFLVPLWRDDTADQIEQVSTEEAVAMAIRLAREEGPFAGTSTGGNVVAALRLAEQLGPEATIVTLLCDTGMKYLSSAMYQAHTSSHPTG